MTTSKLSKKKIHEDIKREGRVLGLHAGAVEVIADKVTDKILTWGKKRSAITENDLYQRMAKELKKYNEDLAYLFESRNKVL